MQVMLVGATGLVGRHVLSQLLVEDSVERVVAPTRRPLELVHAKLLNPVVDFDALPVDAPWWQVDSVVCTLGTTMKQAGSREAFRRVDHAYPLAVARQALRGGALSYALNSAAGADADSRFFYNRVKGELERDLAALGYVSLTLVRPGLIDGARSELRPAEHLGGIALRALAPLLPRRMRVNPAERIATALVDAALQARPGTHVVKAEQLAA
ncbi:NAD-dependent dehydratase [Pseudoxanthomonas sp. GM95]|uniref:NAD-dependent dehydratase n=1 Tax=Pseudoxanthomonas sp. GM95 TaxID=1881043 RepID=UPI000B835B73|nr:NAD-dependent dehydratase [Pseudoxanthomonas sp. GM95]